MGSSANPIGSMKFPHPIGPHHAFHYDWFNQITDYVTQLEERVAELERLQKGESIDGSLSSNPWIEGTEI